MADSSPQGAPRDRYVVQEYLSEGGMGAIYIGKKLGAGGFSKPVVLKQLLPEFTSQREFRELFLREARLSATLDHANIVHTIDLVNANEDFFIVMEYVPGADLRTLLKKAKRRQQRFSPAAGIYATRELLSALSYAHGKRSLDGQPLHLIHRDVSPSNILISAQGEVKLTDFGIAKASTHNSVLYRVRGKMGYMSPEQAKSESMDHRSDLYSLAVCLYEMVAGERLFVKAGLSTSADEMYSQPVPLLSRQRSDIPPEFDKVMLKALHVDPRHRYQSASAFQDALLRCAHRAGLMMSTPELAAHLREVCGDPEHWREQDDEAPADGNRGGTEVLESEDGTMLLGPDDSDLQLVSVLDVEHRSSRQSSAGNTTVNERERREQRSRSSMFALDRLRGMELTSLIDLSRQRPEGDSRRRPSGSRPLVDVADLGLPGVAPGLGDPRLSGPARPPALAAQSMADAGLRSLNEELEPMSEPSAPARAPMLVAPAAPVPAAQSAWTSAPAGMPATPGMPAMPGAHPAIAPVPGLASAPIPPAAPAGPPLARKRRRVSPVLVVLLVLVIIIIGVTAAVLIGLSGPDMGDTLEPPGAGEPSEPRDPAAPP